MKVIRVENKKGFGMFNCCRSAYDIDGLQDLCKRHFDKCSPLPFPRPEEDNLPEYQPGSDWLCAFKSLEQFNSLITREEAKILIKNGFKILILDVENYREGGNQFLFKRNSIKTKTCINKLFK